MFQRMDMNADGKVTRGEFLGLWADAFRNQDVDGDGTLNVAEFGHPVSFKHADANQDGKATLTEFTCMYSKQFDGLDKNNDGLLMVDEM
jgi:Ca2+-binding EF-hand superfamily protein